MDQEPHDESHSQDSCHAEPDEHRIRLRAYEIWEAEGRPEGRAKEHWIRARWELERAAEPEGRVERLERELGHEDEPG
jgi:Protein of unknown function (DUF2934)